MCFANVYYYYYFNGQNLATVSQNLLDPYLPNFYISMVSYSIISFSDHWYDVAMETNFRSKIGEIGDMHSFMALQYRNSDFKRSNGSNLSVLCKQLVRFGPVTPDIKPPTIYKWERLQ